MKIISGGNVRFVRFLIALVMLTSCDSLNTIHVEVESEATVGGGILSTTFNTLGFNDFVSFDVSSSAEFENNDATKNNIGSAYVTSFILEVVSPDNQTLGFVTDMEIFIGDGDSDPGTRIAYIGEDQDTNVETLYLQVYSDQDISQYLRAESTKVTVEAKGSPPSEETVIKATVGFNIQLQF